MHNISIIIPSYRSQNTIARTINSLLLQKEINTEIIVIEDGILDDTKKIVCQFPKVKHIQLSQNHGACYARNLGLKKAIYENIMFIDSDDYIEGHFFLTNMIDDLDRVNASLVIGPCKKIWESSKKTIIFTPPKSEKPKELIIRWLCGQSGPAPCSIIWKKDEIHRIGGWNENYTKNQDGELIIRAMLSDCKLTQSYNGFGVYVQHSRERVSGRVDDKAFESLLALDFYIRKKIISYHLYDLYPALATYELQIAKRAEIYSRYEQRILWENMWKKSLEGLGLKDLRKLNIKYQIMHLLCKAIGLRAFNILHKIQNKNCG